MASFRKRVLQALNRIYSPDGGASPNRIETDTSIQIVHDVSRQSEFGAGLGKWSGFFLNQADMVHAAANTQRSFLDPYARVINGNILESTPPPVEEWWIWHLGTFVWLSASNCSYIRVAVAYDNGIMAYSPNDVFIPVFYADSSYAFTNYAGSGDVELLTEQVMANQPSYVPFPMPYGAVHTFQSVSTGVLTAHVHVLCWAGMKGTFPPGRF